MKVSNIRIAGKLSGLIFIAFSGMISLAVVSQFLMDKVYTAANYGSQNSVPSLRALSHANDALTMVIVQLQRHVLNTDSAAIGEIERDIRLTLAEVDNSLRDYEDLISNAGDRRLLEADKVAVADLGDLVNQVLPLSRAGKNAEARDMLSNERHHLEAVSKAVEEHVQFNLKLAGSTSLEAEHMEMWARKIELGLTLAVLVLLGATSWLMARKGLVFPISRLVDDLTRLASGKLDSPIRGIERQDEIGDIARAADVFKEFAQELNAQGWVKSRVADLSASMQTVHSLEDLAQLVIGKLAHLLQSGAAVFYVLDQATGNYELMGSWGYRERKQLSTSYRLGEGLVGQCAREKSPILLTDVPDDYIRISSGLGEAPPKIILVVPILVKGSVAGVIELASFARFSEEQQSLIDELLPVVALNLEIMERNMRTQALLQETQKQAQRLLASEEELRMQSEELTSANEELRTSEEELRAQSDALKAINEELQVKRLALETAQMESERRATELEAASRYKSDFLANMSHELRTPLNSLLILSRNLSENEQLNLTADQVESLQIIHDGGQHLLRLINDILDLSKVEAGKMTIDEDNIDVLQFAAAIQRNFAILAQNRPIKFLVEVEPEVPTVLRTDGIKLEQIVTNLVGNAFKFTSEGHVSVKFTVISSVLGKSLAIEVEDTGIGIPASKQEKIFSAFEQVDGTSSRQYGGTGLGLTISRRLAGLLGGELVVKSIEGQGSTFTLTLPLSTVDTKLGHNIPAWASNSSDIVSIDDDRATLGPDEQVVLIVEDDEVFARIECDLARQRGFKCLRAADGKTALMLAERYRPAGVLLDIGLPDIDGWTVMAMLQQNPATRDIPVCVISALEGDERVAVMGVSTYLRKPVDKHQLNEMFERLGNARGVEVRRILIVDDDVTSRKAIAETVGKEAIELFEARDGHVALEMLQTQPFDCMILDLELPGGSGFELLDRAKSQGLVLPPVVVYTSKDLSYEESLALSEYTDSIVVKGERSPERLVEEVDQFLRRVEPQFVTSVSAPQDDVKPLEGRTVLVVDDDMRNAFALSKVLRAKGLSVLLAQDGLKALAQLEANEDIELVLMDIMMPGMDGYDTILAIRNEDRYADLPIIALTAKAMPGDREKCMEVGANDYYSKPVDVAQLMVAMSALLHD